MNIIQRSSFPIYQQLFTFLLQAYRVKYLIQRASPLTLRQGKDDRLRQLSLKLRQRLIWFTDILRSYLTETVTALSSADMSAAMIKAEDIDEMSEIHIKFVARLQEQALLSQNLRPIHKAIISLLDLGVLFSEVHNQHDAPKAKLPSETISKRAKGAAKTGSKASRRKSFIPAIVENDSSDTDSADEKIDHEANAAKQSGDKSLEESLRMIDGEFGRLLPFVTAGLRSVGRVGAEPVWEMLAERLEWERKKDRF